MRKRLLKFVRGINKLNSTSVDFDGLWIASWKRDDDAIPKVCEALSLIRSHDPTRYRRLSKDIRGIWCLILPGPLGQFVAMDRLCELDFRFVRSATQAEIASVIIHEATHARLDRLGFGYSEALRPRVEAICVRQQQTFVSRLANPEPMARQLEGYLDLPASYWSYRSRANDYRRGSIAALRELHVPRWAIGLILSFERTKLRRRRKAARDRGRSITKAG